MQYRLIRSKRKTISITVRDAEVLVRAPVNTAKKHIDEFVLSKKKWIIKHLQTQIENIDSKKKFRLSAHSEILYLGKPVPLSEILPKRILQTDGGFDHELLIEGTKIFYRMEAHRIINEKVGFWSEKMGVKPAKTGITGARTRWGSCTSKGNLNFSWYLVMASEEQIDYVVVHELAHLKEMNHSQNFWSIVRNYIPDCIERRKELKMLNRRLVAEDWG